MKPQHATVTTCLLLGLTVGTLFSGAAFAQTAISPSATGNAAPSPWDQQPNGVATQAEASFANYRFRDGETLDRLKIHYVQLSASRIAMIRETSTMPFSCCTGLVRIAAFF